MNHPANHPHPRPSSSAAQQARLVSHRYWRQYRHLTLCLLLSWFALTFGMLFFASELSGIVLFGWPVSLYMAAQGLTFFYVFLLALFSVRAGAIEQRQTVEMAALANAQASTTDGTPSNNTPTNTAGNAPRNASGNIVTHQPDKSTWHD